MYAIDKGVAVNCLNSNLDFIELVHSHIKTRYPRTYDFREAGPTIVGRKLRRGFNNQFLVLIILSPVNMG